jgi:arylformamidase
MPGALAGATPMQHRDPQWLEAQYNNRARVPDHARHLEGWVKASALSRERLSCRLDLRYGDGPGETLDVFPTPRADAPVLVFIHGGYWRALDKSDVSFVAPSFVADGAMVVVPNYALCPSVGMETIALQMTRAVDWAWRNAGLYGGNRRRIVVAGHSAGGHLAALLLACRWDEVAPDLPPHLLAGALSISGVFDLEPVRHTPFLQDDLRLSPESVARLSPARVDDPGGRLHAHVGAEESEEFLRQNRLVRDRWGARTVPVCEAVPGANHFTVLQELVKPDSRLHRSALQLLGLS